MAAILKAHPHRNGDPSTPQLSTKTAGPINAKLAAPGVSAAAVSICHSVLAEFRVCWPETDSGSRCNRLPARRLSRRMTFLADISGRDCGVKTRTTHIVGWLLYSFLDSVPSLGVVGGIASCFRASPSFASVSLISRRIV